MPTKFPPAISSLLATLVFGVLMQAQSFDAASVKPALGGRPSTIGGPGTKEPGRVRFANTTLEALLLAAYDIPAFQLSAPGWMETERYDIDAVLPSNCTRAQFRLMLQNLLAARFQMKAHRETRELSGYDLAAVKTGVKLQSSTEELGPPPDPEERPPLNLGKDRFFIPPRSPGVFLQLIGTTGAREDFRQYHMAELATLLGSQLGRPVHDATGLTGPFDFTLTFATEGLDIGHGRIPVNGAAVENPPDIVTALRTQAGLRLELRKMPVEVLVIDHAEKAPTEN